MFFKSGHASNSSRPVCVLRLTGWRGAARCGFTGLLGPGWAGSGCALTDRPSSGSWLIPAALQPAQNSFLQREMGNSDGCLGNRSSAKPFPFSTNEKGGGCVCDRGHHKVIRRGGRGSGRRVTLMMSNGNDKWQSYSVQLASNMALWHASINGAGPRRDFRKCPPADKPTRRTIVLRSRRNMKFVVKRYGHVTWGQKSKFKEVSTHAL